MNYKKASDTELWQCCQQGDIQAYNTLFYRYAPRLFRQASRYVGEPMDAEEIVMDLLFNLWKKRETLSITGVFERYLFRSLHNRVINYLRRNISSARPSAFAAGEEPSDSRQADYRLRSAELERAYEAKLEALSPRRKKIFMLSREENLTYQQIAQKMNLSVHTVESHMAAALRQLRESTSELTTIIIILTFLLRT